MTIRHDTLFYGDDSQSELENWKKVVRELMDNENCSSPFCEIVEEHSQAIKEEIRYRNITGEWCH